MPATRLKRFLEASGVPFELITHAPAYVAQEVAAVTHTPGRELAKTVMVTLDGRLAMAVLPASHRIAPDMLREVTGADEIHLAPEDSFRDVFPDCKLGAMPPFGNLYELPVYVDEMLAEDEEIAFNACTHTEAIRMRYADYERLVLPMVGRFAVQEMVMLGERFG